MRGVLNPNNLSQDIVGNPLRDCRRSAHADPALAGRFLVALAVICLLGPQAARAETRPQTIAQAFPPLLRDLFDPPRLRRHVRRHKSAKPAAKPKDAKQDTKSAAKPDADADKPVAQEKGAGKKSDRTTASVRLPRPRPPYLGEKQAVPEQQAEKPVEPETKPQQAQDNKPEPIKVPRKKPEAPFPPDSQQAQPAPQPTPAETPKKDAEGQPKPDEQKTAEQPSEPSTCFTALKAVAVIKQLPSIHKGGCSADDVVSLEAVMMPDKRTIPLHPAATLRCPMAAEISVWMRDDMAPLIATLGSPLKSIDNLDSFTCRGRNNVPGAKLSEHGKANALDMRGFTLENGSKNVLTDPHLSRDFRMATRETVCKRFHTVLGPGSDGYHEEHIHLDLEQRRSDYRICQWDVREPVERFIAAAHVAPESESGQHIGLISDDAAASPDADVAPAPAETTKKPTPRRRRAPRSH